MSQRQWKSARRRARDRSQLLEQLRRDAPRWRVWLARIWPGQLTRWLEREESEHYAAVNRAVKRGAHYLQRAQK